MQHPKQYEQVRCGCRRRSSHHEQDPHCANQRRRVLKRWEWPAFETQLSVKISNGNASLELAVGKLMMDEVRVVSVERQ